LSSDPLASVFNVLTKEVVFIVAGVLSKTVSDFFGRREAHGKSLSLLSRMGGKAVSRYGDGVSGAFVKPVQGLLESLHALGRVPRGFLLFRDADFVQFGGEGIKIKEPTEFLADVEGS
jgi:hypothetical protein